MSNIIVLIAGLASLSAAIVTLLAGAASLAGVVTAGYRVRCIRIGGSVPVGRVIREISKIPAIGGDALDSMRSLRTRGIGNLLAIHESDNWLVMTVSSSKRIAVVIELPKTARCELSLVRVGDRIEYDGKISAVDHQHIELREVLISFTRLGVRSCFPSDRKVD
jgi:hypothetical protein